MRHGGFGSSITQETPIIRSCGMILVLLLISVCSLAEVRAEPALNQQVEKALLNSDWKEVAQVLGDTDSLNLTPVMTMIKGHSCLALNDGNLAVVSFLRSSSVQDLKTWKEWTTDFTARNPNNATAFYLRGDAQARLQNWEAAIVDFTEALMRQPDNSLFLDARGVALCAVGRWKEGEKDLSKLSLVAPSFADGFASLGTYWLMRGGLDAASSAYSAALNIDSASALAVNGMACVDFLKGPKAGLATWNGANAGFAGAAERLPVLSFVTNMDMLRQAATETVSKAVLSFGKEDIRNWDSLRVEIQKPDCVLHRYFQSIELPDSIDRNIIDRFDAILEETRFYDDNIFLIWKCFGLHRSVEDSVKMAALIIDTDTSRHKAADQLDAYERSMIRGLNRGLLEMLYPNLIRSAGESKAGMSVTLSGGLAYSGHTYKSTLTTPQLLAGQNRMQNVYSPMATFLRTAPVISVFTKTLGTYWGQHLASSIQQSQNILANRGVPAYQQFPGGVSFYELLNFFFRRDKWPVANLFGLCYAVEPERSQMERKN